MMNPSASVAERGRIGVADALEGIVVFVISKATGAVFTTGKVIVAGVASDKPVLSVTVNVKESLPTKVPLGSYVSCPACVLFNT